MQIIFPSVYIKNKTVKQHKSMMTIYTACFTKQLFSFTKQLTRLADRSTLYYSLHLSIKSLHFFWKLSTVIAVICFIYAEVDVVL